MNELGKEVLRKVAKRIRKSPKLYDQNWFTLQWHTAKCTTHCILGWCGIYLSKSTEEGVREAMELSTEEFEKLYWASQWPSQFYNNNYPSWSDIPARVAAARIEHFIKTNGQE